MTALIPVMNLVSSYPSRCLLHCHAIRNCDNLMSVSVSANTGTVVVCVLTCHQNMHTSLNVAQIRPVFITSVLSPTTATSIQWQRQVPTCLICVVRIIPIGLKDFCSVERPKPNSYTRTMVQIYIRCSKQAIHNRNKRKKKQKCLQ